MKNIFRNLHSNNLVRRNFSSSNISQQEKLINLFNYTWDEIQKHRDKKVRIERKLKNVGKLANVPDDYWDKVQFGSYAIAKPGTSELSPERLKLFSDKIIGKPDNSYENVYLKYGSCFFSPLNEKAFIEIKKLSFYLPIWHDRPIARHIIERREIAYLFLPRTEFTVDFLCRDFFSHRDHWMAYGNDGNDGDKLKASLGYSHSDADLDSNLFYGEGVKNMYKGYDWSLRNTLWITALDWPWDEEDKKEANQNYQNLLNQIANIIADCPWPVLPSPEGETAVLEQLQQIISNSTVIQQELTQAQQQVQQLQTLQTQLQQQITQNQQTIADLENQITNNPGNPEYVQQLQQQITQLTSENQTLQTTLTNQTDQITQLNFQVTNLQTVENNLTISLQQCEIRKKELEHLLNDKDKDIAEWSASYDKQKEKLETCRTDKVNLYKQISKLEKEIATLTATGESITELEQKLVDAKTKKETLKKQVRDLETNLAKSEKDLAVCKAEKTSLEREKEHLEKEVEKYSKLLTGIQDHANKLADDIAELNKIIAGLTKDSSLQIFATKIPAKNKKLIEAKAELKKVQDFKAQILQIEINHLKK